MPAASARVTRAVNLSLICVAGGTGARFGGDKLSERVCGAMVLELSLRRLHEAWPEAPLIVVVGAQRTEFWRRQLTPSHPDVVIVAGGARRQDSVRCGVSAVGENCDTVLIHDGARPLVHVDDVRAVVQGLGSAAGAVLCGPVTDTVKQVAPDGTVASTIARDDLRLAQTPQVFRRTVLEQVWNEGDFEREWTDESAMVEAFGMPVRLIMARYANPKLTTAADLAVLQVLAERQG